MKKVKRGASGPEPGRRVGVLTISVFRKWKHIRGRETVRPQRADNAVRGLIFIVRPQGKHHGTKPRIGGWSRITEIGRAQVCTTVTNAHLVFRLLLAKITKFKTSP